MDRGKRRRREDDLERFDFGAKFLIWKTYIYEKNDPDMIGAVTVRAAMQNAQTLNVVRLKASQMLNAS